MYAEVIPVRRMPTSLPFLDYAVPKEMAGNLKIGQLVKIPLRQQMEYGIVKNIINQSKEKLKDIVEIVSNHPLLSGAQLNFLNELSEFYKTSLGFLIKTNLLPLQKRKLEKYFSSTTDLLPKNLLDSASDSTGLMPRPELFIYQNYSELNNFYQEKLNLEGQHLILFPELPTEAEIVRLIPVKFLEKIAIVSSDLTPKQNFDLWLKIWTGEKKIILGTRTALFLPWHNLKNIFLDNEGHSSYKSWDMTPRYQTRDACLFLAKQHQTKLFFLSPTPSVETYFFAKHKIYSLKNQLQNIKFPVQIINSKNERRAGNQQSLGMDLTEAIKHTTGDVFLCINRLGTFNFVICKDCGEIATCPTCQKAYTYIRSKNNLRCPNCRTERPVSAECHNCHSLNLRAFGTGTQAVEDEIKKNYPERLVLRLDSDSTKIGNTSTANAIPSTKISSSNKPKIIIGTRLAWPHLNWEKIKVMAFLEADTPLVIPEFKALEDWWQVLRDAAFRLPDTAHFFIQTNHPEHLIFQALHNPESFYQTQLKERKILGYPPYNYLWRAIIGHEQPEVVEKQAKKAYNTLNSLTNRGFTGKLTGPIKTDPYLHKGRYWQVILAKIPYSRYKQETKLLGQNLSNEWKIDPNPNNLLTF